MSNINLYNFIDEIQDFPKKGILFRDISPLLEDKDAFKSVSYTHLTLPTSDLV